MSAGYAERLSAYPNKGVVGLPESFDSVRSLKLKINKLVELIQSSNHVVVLTGAGISTSSGIKDFRGPDGIWTREEETRTGKTNRWSTASSSASSNSSNNSQNNKKKRTRAEEHSSTTSTKKTPQALKCLSEAQPTTTHYAISQLVTDSKVKYVITQNVDGLHRRSGLSRQYHSSVHGCVFTSKCFKCGTEYFQDDDTGGLSFQPLKGKMCSRKECSDGQLHDMLLDWNDSVLDIDRSESECEQADLVLCLGTSLRIDPVGSLPLKGKKFVIVNLQATPHDEHATLIIRGLVDDVMNGLMLGLGYLPNWKDTTVKTTKIERVWEPADNQSVKAFQDVVHDANERRQAMKEWTEDNKNNINSNKEDEK
mmetsp:Transcript_37181/g.90187  ORF Transcript_37181/g.90187 Transcript_37181/m.90187 type:complete len:367 (+) Transcript_37181:455-1555(+)